MSATKTLRQYRIERAMDVRAFARFVGVTTQTLYRIEAGENIRMSTIAGIARTLRVKPTDIAEFAALLQRQMEEAATPQPAAAR